jgi:NTP pyrophosphatase (non-canonical NTP hydrolase)
MLAKQHHDAQVVLESGFAAAINMQAKLLSSWNAQQGFWESENVGEKIALIHSELSEALEADRKDLPSDHIDGFSGVEEELADVMIRVLDFAGHFDLRLAEAFAAKVLYNLSRPYRHGKAY